MRPINTQERRKSFQRFLLFFVITVAIMATTLFFGIRIPYAENDKLREQLTQMENENRFRDNFSLGMAETTGLLDTVNLDAAKSGLIDGRITQKLQDLDAMVNKQELTSKTIYTQVIKLLGDAQSDKKSLRLAGNKDSVVALYNSQVQELKNQISKWQESYNQLRMQNDLLRQMK